MAREQDPKIKEAFRLLFKEGKNNRETANILDIDEKKVATWKCRYEIDGLGNVVKKNNVVQHKKKRSSTTNESDVVRQTKREVKKKRVKAKKMYLNNMTQKEISKQLDVPMGTVGNWAIVDKWTKSIVEIKNRINEEMFEEIHGLNKAIIVGTHNIVGENLKNKLRETNDVLAMQKEIEIVKYNNVRIDTFKKAGEILAIVTGEKLAGRIIGSQRQPESGDGSQIGVTIIDDIPKS